MRRLLLSLLTVAVATGFAACSSKPKTPGPTSAGPPPFPASAIPRPATEVVPPPPVPPEPMITSGGDISSASADPRSIAEINKNSPLKPAFFAYDSDTLDDLARKALNDNAQVLKANSTWVITIEGHCDERGTAEYNLALADRRALAAKSYLLSLGIAADRLKTVSYGKEFPFDPGHDEDSWLQNRRAHFTLTAK
jgi:peptidoglycan-associated lipoprotein